MKFRRWNLHEVATFPQPIYRKFPLLPMVVICPSRIRIADAMPAESSTNSGKGGIRSSLKFVVVLYFTVGSIIAGFDIFSMRLWHLDYLSIPYPHIIHYIPLIVPLVGFALWIVFKRSMIAAVVIFLGVSLAYTEVTRWAADQPVKIPVTCKIDSIGSYEWEAWERKLGFKMVRHSDRDVSEIWVDRTRGRSERVKEALKHMGDRGPTTQD